MEMPSAMRLGPTTYLTSSRGPIREILNTSSGVGRSVTTRSGRLTPSGCVMSGLLTLNVIHVTGDHKTQSAGERRPAVPPSGHSIPLSRGKAPQEQQNRSAAERGVEVEGAV